MSTTESKRPSLAQEGAESMLFVLIDVKEADREITTNYKWLLAFGIIKLLGGILSLSAPILASEFVEWYISISLLFVGCANIVGLFFAEKGFKIPSFLLGLAQVYFAYLLQYFDDEVMLFVTFYIACMCVGDGLHRIAIAWRNRDLPGWGSVLFSGLAAIGAGVMVLLNVAVYSLFIVGVIFGIHQISVGSSLLSLGLAGRRIAKEKAE